MRCLTLSYSDACLLPKIQMNTDLLVFEDSNSSTLLLQINKLLKLKMLKEDALKLTTT